MARWRWISLVITSFGRRRLAWWKEKRRGRRGARYLFKFSPPQQALPTACLLHLVGLSSSLASAWHPQTFTVGAATDKLGLALNRSPPFYFDLPTFYFTPMFLLPNFSHKRLFLTTVILTFGTFQLLSKISILFYLWLFSS